MYLFKTMLYAYWNNLKVIRCVFILLVFPFVIMPRTSGDFLDAVISCSMPAMCYRLCVVFHINQYWIVLCMPVHLYLHTHLWLLYTWAIITMIVPWGFVICICVCVCVYSEANFCWWPEKEWWRWDYIRLESLYKIGFVQGPQKLNTL
jgi:hypothetical protein